MVLSTIENQFGSYVNDLATKLNVNPDWIYIIMYTESSFNPNKINAESNARGLFQFMPATLRDLGASYLVGTNIPVKEQFNLAYKFLEPHKGQYKDLLDLYLAVFYPYAIGKGLDFVIGSEVSPARVETIAKQNQGLAPGKNEITNKDVMRFIYSKAKYLGFSLANDFFWKVFNGR